MVLGLLQSGTHRKEILHNTAHQKIGQDYRIGTTPVLTSVLLIQ